MTATLIESDAAAGAPTYPDYTVTAALAGSPSSGDLLIVATTFVGTDEPCAPTGPPVGYRRFNAADQYYVDRLGADVLVYGKVADGTETGASVEFTTNVTDAIVIIALVSGAVLGRFDEKAVQGLASAPTIGGVTFADDGMMLAFDAQTAGSASSTPAGWTLQENQAGSGGNRLVLLSNPSTAGAQGSDTMTGSQTEWATYTLALPQVRKVIETITVDVSQNPLRVGLPSGLEFVPDFEDRRALTEQPPEPTPHPLPGTPWVPRTGQFRR